MALRSTAFLDASTYGFEWLRLIPELSLQEGVLGVSDFKVTAAVAGGMRVDIAAGIALVKGDSGTLATGLTQGLYPQVNDANIPSAITLTASHPSSPRVDQIILQINDSTDLGSPSNVPSLTLITGAATVGATLDTRSGAGVLPSNALRLADVIVPAASVAVAAGNIRDRRPWARGAYSLIERTTGTYTQASTTIANIDATNLAPRIECSGVPIRVRLRGVLTNSVDQSSVLMGVNLDGIVQVGQSYPQAAAAGGSIGPVLIDYIFPAPNVGSHVFYPVWAVASGGGTATLLQSAAYSLQLEIKEIVRQNANNT
jgi:hypothetical protein